MTVTANHEGAHGVLIGPLGTIHGIVSKYDGGNAERHPSFVFAPDGGTNTILRASEWTFHEDLPAHAVGWVTDSEYPLSEGYAPIYVTSSGEQYMPCLLSDDGTTFRAIKVALPAKQLLALV